MRRLLAVICLGLALSAPRIGSACGDKFLVSGRGPSLVHIHRPPKPLAILIYGNSSSAAVAAISKDKVSETLTMVGHSVTKCANPDECARALSEQKYDVVIADPSDAASLRGTIAPKIVPVVLKPSKDDMGKIKDEYSVAFDASRDPVRLLPVLSQATKVRHQ